MITIDYVIYSNKKFARIVKAPLLSTSSGYWGQGYYWKERCL